MANKLYRTPEKGKDFTGKEISEDLLKYQARFNPLDHSGFDPDPRSEKIDYMMILDHSV